MHIKSLSALAVIMLLPAAVSASSPMTKIPAKIAGIPMDQDPVYNPEGTEIPYIMNVTEYGDIFGQEDQDGYKMTIRMSDDGKTIWFRDLNPGYNRYSDDEEYSWIKGTVDGNDITVKTGQVLYANEKFDQKLYFEAVTVDGSGQVNSFLDEFHFTISDNRIVQTDDNVYVAVYEDGETMDDAGIYMFFFNYTMEPMGDIHKVTPPEEIPVQQWLMTSTSDARFVSVARDGDTVYIAGLSEMAPEDYVSGTIKNGVLTINSGYILTSNPRYYIRLIGAVEGEPDEFGYPTLNMIMQYSFDVTDDGNRLTLSPADTYIVEAGYSLSNFYSGIQEVNIFPYSGDKPAVPAMPTVEHDSLNDMLYITIPSTDTDGNYINPEHITYRVFFDGEPYRFTPGSYNGLTEPMTDISYKFTDYYDFYVNGSLHTIYLHDVPEWTTVEVESTYTVDGISNSSGRQPADLDSVSGADRIAVSETVTDLAGRIISNPAPGSIVIITTKYDDGSTKTAKRLIK